MIEKGVAVRPPVRVAHASRLPGVTMIDAYWAAEPPPDCLFETYVIRRHDHGVLGIRHRGERHRAMPGTYTVQPGEMLVHDRPDDPPVASVAVSVDVDLLDGLVAEASGSAARRAFAGFRLDGDGARSVRRSVTALFAAVARDAPGLEQEHRLQSLVSDLLPALSTDSRNALDAGSAAVSTVRDYLHENLAASVSLDDLATITQVSKYHLSRTFAQQVGVPPHAYHLHLRVARARTLLSEGLAVAETAAALGFADQSHLGRRFRAVAAVTPAQY